MFYLIYFRVLRQNNWITQLMTISREKAHENRCKAMASGKITYKGTPCKKHNHEGTRYVRDGHCIHCSRRKQKVSSLALCQVIEAKIKELQSMLNAAKAGESSYISSKKCVKCGTSRRYLINKRGCVMCKKILNAYRND